MNEHEIEQVIQRADEVARQQLPSWQGGFAVSAASALRFQQEQLLTLNKRLDEITEQFNKALAVNETIKTNNASMYSALENLVFLKNRKDKVGKDDFYTLNQPKAWRHAKTALRLANAIASKE